MARLLEPRQTARQLRRQWFQLQKRRWQAQNNPGCHSRPLFVVGCQRSGTNMLVRALDCAWVTELYNENNPQAFCNYHLRDLDAIAALVETSSAQVVVFKPIADTYRTHLLSQHFPEAHVLFALRHYAAVVESMMRAFSDDPILRVQSWLANDFDEFAGSPPSAYAKQRVAELYSPALNAASCRALVWWVQNHFYFDLGLNVERRALLVRYESVVDDPARAFRSICEFAGIGFTTDIIAGIYAAPTHAEVNIAVRVRAACQELWEQLTPAQ